MRRTALYTGVLFSMEGKMETNKRYLSRAKNYIVEVEMDLEKKKADNHILDRLKEVEESINDIMSIIGSE